MTDTDSSRRIEGLTSDLDFVWMNEVEERVVDWVQEGWLARRTLTLLDGDPGINKSSYVYDVAASVTRDGGVAILLQAEDDAAVVAKPRLKAAGARLDRVMFVSARLDRDGHKQCITIPDDIDTLRAAIQHTKTKFDPNLVFIGVDPVVAYLDSHGTNSWKDQDVRRALQPLHDLCVEEDAACLVVRHFKKGTETKMIHQGGGSIAFQGLVRLACAIVLDPEDDEPDPNKRARLLVSVKSNLGKKPRSRRFRIAPYRYDTILTDGSLETIETFRLKWEGDSDLTADNMGKANGDEEHQTGSGSKQHRAEDFIRGILATGPVDSTIVLTKGEELVGVSERTLRRAAKALGISKRKVGAARQGTQRWEWALPGLAAAGNNRGLVMSKPGDLSIEDGHLKDHEQLDMTKPRLRVEGPDWNALMAAAKGEDGVQWSDVVDVDELHNEIDRYSRALYEKVRETSTE